MTRNYKKFKRIMLKTLKKSGVDSAMTFYTSHIIDTDVMTRSDVILTIIDLEHEAQLQFYDDWKDKGEEAIRLQLLLDSNPTANWFDYCNEQVIDSKWIEDLVSSWR